MIQSSSAQIAQRTFKIHDKSLIKYSAYKSDDCEKTDKLVLVIALHWGWGQSKLPEYYSKNFLEGFIVPIFSNHNAIIIAPDCTGNSWTEDKSINAILELRNHYVKKYNIEVNSVIITGFSLGGIGTWFYALNYPHLFNYAMPIAGYPKKEWLEDFKGGIEIRALNSFDDEVIPIDKVNYAVEFLKEYKETIRLKIIYGIRRRNCIPMVYFFICNVFIHLCISKPMA